MRRFVGSTNGYQALNAFGAGDIPMTSSRYNEVISHGREMIHVPFAMGGIAIFHSVPAANLGTNGELDLSGCLLAKIFSREIKTWDHPDIVAVNPGMTYTGDIKVVHRVKGSSSTAGFTEYLSQKCPDHWPASLGSGSTIVWPEGTFEGQGSGGMSSFIQDNDGAIGYIDAGHGHSAGLGEVALLNKDNKYLTTKTADIGAAGTLALAASPSVIPASVRPPARVEMDARRIARTRAAAHAPTLSGACRARTSRRTRTSRPSTCTTSRGRPRGPSP